jgi:hypothetical protein
MEALARSLQSRDHAAKSNSLIGLEGNMRGHKVRRLQLVALLGATLLFVTGRARVIASAWVGAPAPGPAPSSWCDDTDICNSGVPCDTECTNRDVYPSAYITCGEYDSGWANGHCEDLCGDHACEQYQEDAESCAVDCDCSSITFHLQYPDLPRYHAESFCGACVGGSYSARSYTPFAGHINLVPTLRIIPDNLEQFITACLNFDAWPAGSIDKTTYLGANDALYYPSVADDNTLANCFAAMNQHGIQLSLEVDAKTGDPYTAGEIAGWNHLTDDLGAPLGLLRMDSPLSNGIYNNYVSTYCETVQITAEWIAYVRDAYPDVRIADIEQLFTLFTPSELRLWIGDLNNACEALGVKGPDVLEFDQGAWFANPSGACDAMDDLIDFAHSQGEDVSVIFFGARPGSGGLATASFAENVLAQWLSYYIGWPWGNGCDGVAFDMWTLESWDQTPIPECVFGNPPLFDSFLFTAGWLLTLYPW